jgi:hypothetical protein
MRVLALVPAFLLGFVAAAQAAVPAECWNYARMGITRKRKCASRG